LSLLIRTGIKRFADFWPDLTLGTPFPANLGCKNKKKRSSNSGVVCCLFPKVIVEEKGAFECVNFGKKAAEPLDVIFGDFDFRKRTRSWKLFN
jgi:hypothetical protein